MIFRLCERARRPTHARTKSGSSYTLSQATWEHRFSSEDFDIEQRAALLRASMDPEALPCFRQVTADIDVRAMVLQLRMPTLVLCRPAIGFRQPELSEELAAMLPNARLRVLAPRTGGGEDPEWLEAVESFLRRGD